MRLIVLLASIPIGLAAVLHWHWLKDQIVHGMIAETIRFLLRRVKISWRPRQMPAPQYDMRSFLKSILEVLVPNLSMPEVLVPDISIFLNQAMIWGGLASLVCSAFLPRLRPVLIVGGLGGVAVGMSRESARMNLQRQASLEA